MLLLLCTRFLIYSLVNTYPCLQGRCNLNYALNCCLDFLFRFNSKSVLKNTAKNHEEKTFFLVLALKLLLLCYKTFLTMQPVCNIASCISCCWCGQSFPPCLLGSTQKTFCDLRNILNSETVTASLWWFSWSCSLHMTNIFMKIRKCTSRFRCVFFFSDD